MAKLDVSSLFKTIAFKAKKHSPDILMGVGIAGMISTTILAVKATPKACRLLEEKKREEEVDSLTVKETIQTCWKCYIPSATTCVTSMACLIGANSVNSRRNAALATAYALSETTIKEYKDAVVEKLGEKGEKEVRELVAKEKVESNPVVKNEIIMTGKGETLCYESLTGRYFKSDIDTIKRALNEFNEKMLNYDYMSLNEFFDFIGLDNADIGEDIGWHITRGLLELDFSSQLASDGTPCMVIGYQQMPTYGFERGLSDMR